MERYGCIKDLQGGEFAVGVIDTIEGWRNIAIEWTDNDSNYELGNTLKQLPKAEIIDFIQDIWDLEIIEIDTEEKELVCKCKEKIRFDMEQAGKLWEEIYNKYGNDFEHLSKIMEMFTDNEVYAVTDYLKEKSYKKIGY